MSFIKTYICLIGFVNAVLQLPWQVYHGCSEPRQKPINILRPDQNGCHFADDIFKCIFLNENYCILLLISLEFVHRGSTGNISVLILEIHWHITSNKLLTHWGQVTHICVSKLTIIASDNGLSPGRRQAIIWKNAEILSIQNLGTKFSEIINKILTFLFKKMHLKVSSAK